MKIVMRFVSIALLVMLHGVSFLQCGLFNVSTLSISVKSATAIAAYVKRCL